MYNLIVILGYRLKNNKITKKLENRLKKRFIFISKIC